MRTKKVLLTAAKRQRNVYCKNMYKKLSVAVTSQETVHSAYSTGTATHA